MSAIKDMIGRVDQMQRSQPWLAFPVAVWKKFGDEQAGNLAALVAYYAFASLFPLLLVLVTVLDIVLGHDPSLHQKVVNSAFGQFPVIGPQLKNSVHTLHQTGLALVIGLILTFLGARGVANAAQNAMNTVWGVPFARRPQFVGTLLRNIGWVLVVGIGLIVTTLLSGLAGASSHVLGGTAAEIGTVAVSLLLNIGVFWLAFRLATASEVRTRDLLLGAVLGAIVWQVLQTLGGYLIARDVSKSSSLYGTFALVLGLLTWLFLQAQLTLYAVEINVVRVRKLWPRSLAPPPLTEQDRAAYQLYAETQERRPEQDIESHVPDSDMAPDAAPAPTPPRADSA